MDRRSFLGLTLGLPLYLTACARSESYRYKLTLSLDTLDGVKSGFNVVEVSHNEVSFPARGVVAHVKGEALYLDLGPGRRPLIARLTKRQGPKGWGDGWEEDRPTVVLARRYGETRRITDLLETVSRFTQKRGAVSIDTYDLPDLVTFADVADPASVMAVDPDDLTATLGPGIHWRSIKLEVTDDPLTRGIEKRLPWIIRYSDKMLDGMGHGRRTNPTLASRMNTASFKRAN